MACETRTGRPTTRRPDGSSSATSAATSTPPPRRNSTRRSRRQLRLAGLRGRVPGPVHQPAVHLRAQRRQRRHHWGFVYRGNQFPSSMRGNYFFADYAQHWIKRLTFDANGNVERSVQLRAAQRKSDRVRRRRRLSDRRTGRGALLRRPRVLRHLGHVRGQQGPPHQLPAVQPGAGRARLGEPVLGSGPARCHVLERGIDGSRGPAHQLLLGLRRRHLVDGEQPGRTPTRSPASTSCG